MKKELSRLKKQLSLKIDECSARLIEISEFIHQNPEIGFKEYKSSQALIKELQSNDFIVEKNTAGLKTAFTAVARGKEGGPAIAFLSEYDALPEIGHACGHNIIGTASLGAGIAVKSIIKELTGKVYVVGTPAEEGGGGKIIMLEKGVFKKIDISLMVHPFNKTYSFLPSLAAKPIEFIFYGKAAHSAISPEEGLNALDAVVQTYNSINALRLQLPGDVSIHGIITDGGLAPNIISARAAVKYAVRTKNQNYLDELMDKVKACARGAAMATGTTLEINESWAGYDAIKNNIPIDNAIKKNLKLLSIKQTPPSMEAGGMGSLDMGNISRIMPSAHPFLAISDDFAVHTDQFREAAISKRGHEMMLKAAKLLAYTALDLFMDNELLEKAKQDFINNRVPL
ncbi:MAG: M20 family metallopeptidase [Desulfobacula sp.]|jgi:amidohydrolase|nr:M20 family metallopeptidase [Desulfobacula sp.]MBT7261561.1 M20 family metallopeptidase [Desulfobacula sp.]